MSIHKSLKLGTLFVLLMSGASAYGKTCTPIAKGMLDTDYSQNWCVLSELNQDFNRDGSIDHVLILEKDSKVSEQRAFSPKGLPIGDFQQSTPRSLVVVLSRHGKQPEKIDRNDFFLLRREEAGISNDVDVELLKAKRGFTVTQTFGRMTLTDTLRLTPNGSWQLIQRSSQSIDGGLASIETKYYLKGVSIRKSGDISQGKWSQKKTLISKRTILLKNIR